MILCTSSFLPNGDEELMYKLKFYYCYYYYFMILTLISFRSSSGHELTGQPYELDHVSRASHWSKLSPMAGED
jgi:hypothetical protein